MYCAFLNIDRNLVLFISSELGQELNLFCFFAVKAFESLYSGKYSNLGKYWDNVTR